MILTLKEFKEQNPQESSLEDSLLKDKAYFIRMLYSNSFVSCCDGGFPDTKKKIVTYLVKYDYMLLIFCKKESDAIKEFCKNIDKYRNEISSNINMFSPIELNISSAKFLDNYYKKYLEERVKKAPESSDARFKWGNYGDPDSLYVNENLYIPTSSYLTSTSQKLEVTTQKITRKKKERPSYKSAISSEVVNVNYSNSMPVVEPLPFQDEEKDKLANLREFAVKRLKEMEKEDMKRQKKFSSWMITPVTSNASFTSIEEKKELEF